MRSQKKSRFHKKRVDVIKKESISQKKSQCVTFEESVPYHPVGILGSSPSPQSLRRSDLFCLILLCFFLLINCTTHSIVSNKTYIILFESLKRKVEQMIRNSLNFCIGDIIAYIKNKVAGLLLIMIGVIYIAVFSYSLTLIS